MSTDIVLAWPRHCDYPLWRDWLVKNRPHLGSVVIGFTEHHLENDWRQYVSRELARIGGVRVFDATRADGQDWRDTAVNEMLDRSCSEWVWFMEPDFIIRDDKKFRRAVAKGQMLGDVVGYREDGEDRRHPSCLIVRRSAIEKTSRYFGDVPVDHFHAFCQELERTGARFADLDLRSSKLSDDDGDFTHIGGLSRNEQLVDSREWEEVRRPDEHALYLTLCMKKRCHPAWSERSKEFVEWVHRG